MGKKVLISFIGTGTVTNKEKRVYREATYSFEGKERKSPFVASAMGAFLHIDQYILLGTMHSMWEEVYRHFCPQASLDEDYWLSLGEQCELANHLSMLDTTRFTQVERTLPEGSRIFPIYYGLSEPEIKSNFTILTEAINTLSDGDELYMDITHSFRSLPLMATTAISFIKDVTDKDIQFKGIYYGMLDIAKENGDVAPIVNLSYINELQNWIKGAHAFTHYGKADLLCQLLADKDKTTAQKLEEFAQTLAINYVRNIKTQIMVLKNLAIGNYQMPEKLILPRAFNDFATHFDQAKQESQYQFALAKWHYKKGNTALAYMCLTESIVTMGCEIDGMENIFLEETRKKIKARFKDINSHRNNESLLWNELAELYYEVNPIRVRATHLLENGGKGTSLERAIKRLPEFIKKMQKITTEKY